MLKTASTGIPEGIPVRLPGPEPIPFIQRRPVVDVRTLASRAANEVVTVLAEHQEQEAKAGKSFLRRRQPRPDIDLITVADSLRESITEAYRVSAAACTPPVLDLTEEHQAEIAALQEQAIELFCQQILPAVKDDTALTEQIYGLCPALKPAPEPDLKALGDLQKKVDKAIGEAMSIHEDLIMSLRELDDLLKQEASLLAGTSMAGNGRIKRQAEHVRHELVRLLEKQEVCRQIKIPVARW